MNDLHSSSRGLSPLLRTATSVTESISDWANEIQGVSSYNDPASPTRPSDILMSAQISTDLSPASLRSENPYNQITITRDIDPGMLAADALPYTIRAGADISALSILPA